MKINGIKAEVTSIGSLYVVTIRDDSKEADELKEKIAESPCGMRATETSPTFLSDVYERFGNSKNSFVFTANEYEYSLPHYFNVSR